MYFAECRVVDTRQSSLCRVSQGGTRRVPRIWHSANHILKIKKNLCRVPHRGHSAKNMNLADPTASPSSLSHSRSLAARAHPRRRPPAASLRPLARAARAARAPARRAPAPPARRAPARPCACRSPRARSPRARAPPTTTDDPAPTTSTPSTAHDLHAVTPVRRRAPSTPSK
jgi:hypothetical protein